MSNWVCTLKDRNIFKNLNRRILKDEYNRSIEMIIGENGLIQRIEYPKKEWELGDAQTHCYQQGGEFERLKVKDIPKPKKPEVKQVIKKEDGGKVTPSPLIDHNRTKNTHNLTTDISHLTISDIGTNTHVQIDTHIALVNEHIDWTNASQNLHTSGYGRCSACNVPEKVPSTILTKS